MDFHANVTRKGEVLIFIKITLIAINTSTIFVDTFYERKNTFL